MKFHETELSGVFIIDVEYFAEWKTIDSTFIADALSHASDYPGAYMEAALTGIGAFAFSLVISYTPIGKRIDRLAEGFLHQGAAIETGLQPSQAGEALNNQ